MEVCDVPVVSTLQDTVMLVKTEAEICLSLVNSYYLPVHANIKWIQRQWEQTFCPPGSIEAIGMRKGKEAATLGALAGWHSGHLNEVWVCNLVDGRWDWWSEDPLDFI